jgi:voltage-gated potassium channel
MTIGGGLPAGTEATSSRSERIARWFEVPLLVAALLASVPDRRRWLADHPLEVLIVLLTPPFLPATLKVARVLPVVRAVWLLVLAHRAHRLFSLQGLRYVALLAFAIVVGGGTLFAAVEPEQNLSTWDGLWRR